MKVRLKVIEGSCKGRVFDFEEQDGFTIGRAPDCRCVVEGDPTFSRHHLLLEINQGNVILKDLGSLNGTCVDGVDIQGRDRSVAPEDAEPSKPIPLRDGARIQAGKIVMRLEIEGPAVCVDCGEDIPASEKKACEFINATYLCQACRNRENERNRRAAGREKKPEEVRMNREQREKADQNPAEVADALLREFLDLQNNRNGGPTIRGYKNLKKIGEGGFGLVYKAERVSDGATVALKTLLQTRKPPRKQAMLFDREKEIATQLVHPNIVRNADAGVWNDIHFIEMEFMEAGSVFDLMEKGAKIIPLRDAAPIMLQCLEGLAYAHEAKVTVNTTKGPKTVTGVIHRDLKPPNILLTRKNGQLVAKLSDFGLAKAFAAAGCTQGSLSQSMAGSFCGSPPFMAPEHLANYKYVKPTTDVFEMAATFFTMLTGQFVWPLKKGQDPIKVILESKPRRLADTLPDCSTKLCTVFDHAMARDPKRRYAKGREFLEGMKHAL